MDHLDLIGNRPSRSSYEIIFKTISITTTVFIAAGHLTKLRRISRRDRADAIVGVVGIFLVPTLPFASVLLHSWKACEAFVREIMSTLMLYTILALHSGFAQQWKEQRKIR
jgi:hypothetical protein